MQHYIKFMALEFLLLLALHLTQPNLTETKDKCSDITTTLTKLEDNIQKLEDIMIKAEQFLQSKNEIMRWLQSKYRVIEIFFSGAVSHFYELTEPSQSDTFLNTKDYRDIFNNDAVWQNEHSAKVSPFSECFKKLAKKYDVWNMLQARKITDKNSINDHKGFKTFVESQSATCSYMEESEFDQIYNEGWSKISKIDSDLSFYEEATTEGDSCFDSILSEFDRLYKLLSDHIESINNQIATFAIPHYNKIKETLNNLDKIYDFMLYADIVNKKSTLESKLGQIESVLCDNFDNNEANSINASTNTVWNSYLGFISSNVTDMLSNAIKQLIALIKKSEQLQIFVRIHENDKSRVKKELDNFSDLIYVIQREYMISSGKIRLDITILTEIISSGITHGRLSVSAQREANIKNNIQELNEKYEKKYKEKTYELKDQLTTVEESLTSVIESFENDRNELTTILNDYETLKKNIEAIKTVDIPNAVIDVNLKYLEEKFCVPDPTLTVNSVNEKLDATSIMLNDLKSKHDDENVKITNLQTELLEKSGTVSTKNNGFIQFQNLVNDYESKLMQAYAQSVSNGIQTKHKLLSDDISQNSLQSNQLKTKFDHSISEISKAIEKVATTKKSGEEILGQYNKIIQIKNELSQSKNLHPREFKELVNAEILKLNLDLSTELIVTSEEELSQTAKTTGTSFDQYFLENQQLMSNFEITKASVSEYTDMVDSTIADVTTKNGNLVKMVGAAREKSTLTDALIQVTTNKKSSLDDTSQLKSNYLSDVITRDRNDYEMKNQKVISSKHKLMNDFKSIKNLYINRHNINIDEYDQKYNKKISEYDIILGKLLERKNGFVANSNNVNTQLGHYKSTGARKYEDENSSLSNFKTSLSECINNLIQSINHERYESFMTTCNGVVELFETQQKRNEPFIDLLQTIINNISTLELANVNYDESVEGIESINESSESLIDTYKVELKNLYTEKNKISFIDSGVQNIFNSFEEEFASISGLNIEDFDKPNTKNHQDISESISNEITIYNNFEDKYPKMNVESVIKALYQSLPQSVEEISEIKKDIDEKLKKIEDDFLKANMAKENFDSKKLKASQIKNEIDKLITNYNTQLTSIWDLSEDEWPNRYSALDKSKMDALDEIKSNLQLLAAENIEIKENRNNYNLLKSQVDSTFENLLVIQNSSIPKITYVNSNNNQLDSYLGKYNNWMSRKEEVMPVLDRLESELKEFRVNYPTQIDSLKSQIEDTINSNIHTLENAKTETLRMKSTIKQKVESLSEFYGITNDGLNVENKSLIDNFTTQTDSLIAHCDQFKSSSLERKQEALNLLSTLQQTTSTKSKNLSYSVSSYISRLECCKNVINGINCIDGTTQRLDECDTFVAQLNSEDEISKINELKNTFAVSLVDLNLPTGDIFGVGQLEILKNSMTPLPNFLKKIEESFAKQFHQIKLDTVNSIIPKADTEMSSSSDSINNNLEAITKIQSLIKSLLDQYKAKINAHKKIYGGAEIEFNNISAQADLIEKTINGTSRNKYIMKTVNKEPKVSVILSKYSSDLHINKIFTDFHDQAIEKYLLENKAFTESIREEQQKYDRFLKEFEEIKEKIIESVTDKNINGKIEFEQRLAVLKNKLSQTLGEINHIRAAILNGVNSANESNARIENSDLNASAQIKEFESTIRANKVQKDTLIKTLETMDAKSKLINKNFETYEEVKQRLNQIREQLTLSYQEKHELITTKMKALVDSKNTKLLSLKLNQQRIMEPLNKYFEKLDQLETTVNNAKIDLPPELLEIIERNNKLSHDIQYRYAELKKIINTNFSGGKAHYLNQDNRITTKHAEITELFNSHLNIIEEINNKLIDKSFEELSESFFNDSSTKIQSTEEFMLEKANTTFDVSSYELEGDASCDSEFSDRILLIPDDMKPIDNLLMFLNIKNRKTKSDKQMNAILEPDNHLIDHVVDMKENNDKPINEKTNQKSENNIVQGQMKDLKSFNLINLIIFLAFVAIIVAGINIIIVIRRRNKDKTLYQECDKVYVPVKV